MIGLNHYLAVGAALFGIGLVGFLTRRNLITMFLCAEMMLQGVVLNLLAFGMHHGHIGGQVFALFIVTVAACEAGLALVTSIDGLALGELVEDPERLSGLLMQLYGISDAFGYEHCGDEPPSQKQTQG